MRFRNADPDLRTRPVYRSNIEQPSGPPLRTTKVVRNVRNRPAQVRWKHTTELIIINEFSSLPRAARAALDRVGVCPAVVAVCAAIDLVDTGVEFAQVTGC